MEKDIIVTKREGCEEPFNRNAIIIAINKAIIETDTVVEDTSLIETIPDRILEIVKKQNVKK